MDSKDGKWVTINGAHVFVKNGQTPAEALKELKQKSDNRSSAKSGSIVPGKGDLFVLPLDFFSKKKQNISNVDVQRVKEEMPKRVHGFLNKERLNTAHHINHAKEMGYKTQVEYERGAISFWNNSPGKLYFSDSRNRYYKYDSNTTKFVAVDKEGIIHTFMLYSIKKFNNKIIQEDLYEI